VVALAIVLMLAFAPGPFWQNNLAALTPLPQDMLLGRAHIGDGCIDFGPISEHVLAAGYDGFVEVEIFNQQVWDAPPDDTAATVKARFAEVSGSGPAGRARRPRGREV
jgi:hypothetical protein